MAPPNDQAPVGVLLFNLGGPDTIADVEPFLATLVRRHLEAHP